MKKLKLSAIALVFLSGVFSALPALAGPKWDMGDNSWLKLSLFGQAHYSALDDAPQERDFYLRRLRVILEGQVMEGVKVFAETDYPNAGKSGVNASFSVQDAFVDVQLFRSDHWVKAGLTMLPFSFENGSSATSLLGIDYNTECLKFVNDLVWRDNGVSFQGSVAKRFAYRVGLFDGYDNATNNKYQDAGLRYTGRLDVAVLGEVPAGWFYAQDPLTDNTYLYVGAGADHQNDATLISGRTRDNKAWVADFQSGVKLSDVLHLTINGAWYDWDNSNFTGQTGFVESGLRYQKIIGTLKYSLEDPDSGSNLDNYTVGLHYNLKGNNMKAGVEYRWGDSSNWLLAGLQFLI